MQVVVCEMITADHAVEAIKSFLLCGVPLFYQNVCGEQKGSVFIYFCVPGYCCMSEPTVGVDVCGKYVCLGVHCIKWHNCSYNNLMEPEERIARRML